MNYDRLNRNNLRVVLRPSDCASEYALFFDDSPRHFGKGCDAVLGVRVLTGPLRDTVPETPVLHTRAAQLWARYDMSQTFELSSGIPIDVLLDLARVFRKRAWPEVASVLLDWDKTLTMHSAFRKVIAKEPGSAECFFGGVRRARAIGLLFKALQRARVPVRIITSNPVAKTDEGRVCFAAVLAQVGVRQHVPVEYVGNGKMPHIRDNDATYGIVCNACTRRVMI